jgi:hypothetical protein
MKGILISYDVKQVAPKKEKKVLTDCYCGGGVSEAGGGGGAGVGDDGAC